MQSLYTQREERKRERKREVPIIAVLAGGGMRPEKVWLF
jgi:hypothetical protein